MVAGGWATFRPSGHPILERLGGGQTRNFTRVTTLIPQHTLQSAAKRNFCFARGGS